MTVVLVVIAVIAIVALVVASASIHCNATTTTSLATARSDRPDEVDARSHGRVLASTRSTLERSAQGG
jgi:hypothetical protein